MRECSCCVSKTIRTTTPQNNITVQTSESVALDPSVGTVLANLTDTDDPPIVITLPYQPAPGSTVTVSSATNGTTVKPGCEAAECGCDDTAPLCDTFKDARTEVTVDAAGQVTFVYSPGNPCCSCGGEATGGTWTASDECCVRLTVELHNVETVLTETTIRLEHDIAALQFAGARVTGATLGVPSGTPTALIFNDEATFGYDVGGYFAGADDKFVVPAGQEGHYEIGGSALWAAAPGEQPNNGFVRELRITVDAVIVDDVKAPPVVGGFATSQSLSTSYYLPAGSVVQLLAYQDTGSSLDVIGSEDGGGAQSPCFWITKQAQAPA